MKNSFYLILLLFAFNPIIAQNTFPSTGNVGIGTLIAPAYNLDINSTTTPTIRIGSTTNSGYSDILFKGNYSNANSWKISKDPQGSTTGPATKGSLTFSYHNGVYGNTPTLMLGYTGSSHCVLINSTDMNLYGGCQLAVYGKIGAGSISTTSMVINSTGIASLNDAASVSHGYLLSVDGKIGAREVNVSLASPFPDYVFKPEYKLLSLSEVERHIRQRGQLPEMPSAEQVKNDGLDVAKTTTLLVQKIEELTLYLIELNKKVEKLEVENQSLKNHN
jgi:hypothetical protein